MATFHYTQGYSQQDLYDHLVVELTVIKTLNVPLFQAMLEQLMKDVQQKEIRNSGTPFIPAIPSATQVEDVRRTLGKTGSAITKGLKPRQPTTTTPETAAEDIWVQSRGKCPDCGEFKVNLSNHLQGKHGWSALSYAEFAAQGRRPPKYSLPTKACPVDECAWEGLRLDMQTLHRHQRHHRRHQRLLTITSTLHDRISTFIQHVRHHIEQEESQGFLFLTCHGTPLTNNTINKSLKAFIKKTGAVPSTTATHISSTMLRKAIVTNTRNLTSPEKNQLAAHMAHSRRTADRSYAVVDKLGVAAKAHLTISNIITLPETAKHKQHTKTQDTQEEEPATAPSPPPSQKATKRSAPPPPPRLTTFPPSKRQRIHASSTTTSNTTTTDPQTSSAAVHKPSAQNTKDKDTTTPDPYSFTTSEDNNSEIIPPSNPPSPRERQHWSIHHHFKGFSPRKSYPTAQTDHLTL